MDDPVSHENDLSRVAAVYGEAILAAIQREYPNHLRHVMSGPDDRPTPREIHPAFYGCFDWHSCVEMHWALIRLLRLAPESLDRDTLQAVLSEHLTPQVVQQEAGYLQTHRGFERPYGWGWALMLANELQEWDDPLAKPWAAAVRPLAEVIAGLFLDWLPKAIYPGREGMHSNTAFGLARALPWARHLAREGDGRLLSAISDAAGRWYAQDQNYPAEWEPNGADFLSPALTEAELMCETLEADAFMAWLARFLPGLEEARPATLFEPVRVSDSADGQIAHLHGLNLYRAYAWERLSRALPEGDARLLHMQRAAAIHAAAGLPAVTGTGYMVEHWLAAYAVLYLGAAA